jgi:DNA-binding MarR family transcriptional regulator
LPASNYLESAATPPTAPTSPEIESASRLRAAIGRLSRRLRPTAAASAAGLTPTRVAVLLDVVRRGPVRLGDVAASEGINPTMLSRVIADLVASGLLERVSDAEDRRAAWVRATTRGRRLAERMRGERTDAISIALAGLSVDEQLAIEQAVPALEALAQRLGEQQR